LPIASPIITDDSYVAHLYVIRAPERDRLQQRLRAAGVGSDIHYPTPDHQQESYRHEPWAQVNLPETERACREVLTLPCFSELTAEEVSAVIAAVERAI
jgi:dTDP-4-amino-4,6-dideoxygalactose transaminase